MTERLLDHNKTTNNYGANDRASSLSGSAGAMEQGGLQMEMKEGVDNGGFDGGNIEDGKKNGETKGLFLRHFYQTCKTYFPQILLMFMTMRLRLVIPATECSTTGLCLFVAGLMLQML